LCVLQGFTQSLRDLAFPSLPVPNYTTLCRRAKTLDVELPILRRQRTDPSGCRQYWSEGLWRR
ncbi:MAG: transposase, partial [Burkholderia sp.]